MNAPSPTQVRYRALPEVSPRPMPLSQREIWRPAWRGRIRLWTTIVFAVALSSCAAVTRSVRQHYIAETWTRVHLATHPQGRSQTGMVFDAATGTSILFGGINASGILNDTWAWSGAKWTELNPTVKPSGRADAAIAYDPLTKDVLLFGGSDPNRVPQYGGTWSYNGITWSRLTPPQSPPALSGAVMAFYPPSGDVVLYGGYASIGNRQYTSLETWSWNGITWARLHPPTSPSRSLGGYAIAYDPASTQLILFGNYFHLGASPRSVRARSETWDWNGSTWVQLHPKTSPRPLAGSAMAYDAQLHELILFGGGKILPMHPGNSSSTWAWNGRAWTLLQVRRHPPGLSEAPMSYDGATNQVVLFGGFDATGSITFPHTTWLIGK